MGRHVWLGGAFLLAAGCVPDTVAVVPCDPFTSEAYKPCEVRHVVESPGTSEATERVIAVGCKIVAANLDLGFRPRFITVGTPNEDIYHRGIREVFITEGLVRRCSTDGQLAAVLCLELGKMIAEREKYADPLTRIKEPYVPIEMPVGNDNGGTFGPPDGTRLMEIGKYVDAARQMGEAPLPSPEVLARGYLRKAGFAATELDSLVKTP